MLFKSPSVHVPTPHAIRDLWSYVPDEGGIPILAAAYALVPTLSWGPLKGIGIGRLAMPLRSIQCCIARVIGGPA